MNATIVAIEELPTVPENLWLRLLGKGKTQEFAIEELLLLPESDPKRNNALNLLVSWRISMVVTQQVEQEEERILMALSQTYLAWEKQKKQEGREQGQEQGQSSERRSTIVNLMQLRYGEITPVLESCIPNLMELSSGDYTRLLLQLDQAQLIRHFEN